MNQVPRAQELLARGQAKEQIGFLHGAEAQPGHEHEQPREGHARRYFIDLESVMASFLVQTLMEAATLTKYPRPGR